MPFVSTLARAERRSAVCRCGVVRAICCWRACLGAVRGIIPVGARVAVKLLIVGGWADATVWPHPLVPARTVAPGVVVSCNVRVVPTAVSLRFAFRIAIWKISSESIAAKVAVITRIELRWAHAAVRLVPLIAAGTEAVRKDPRNIFSMPAAVHVTRAHPRAVICIVHVALAAAAAVLGGVEVRRAEAAISTAPLIAAVTVATSRRVADDTRGMT